MSGGSFNYAYHKTEDEMDVFRGLQDYKDIEAYARKLGKHDIADILYEYIQEVETYQRRLMIRGKVIAPLMRAIEWECSGDTGLDGIDYAMEHYWKVKSK